MRLTNEDALMASLLGSQAVKSLPRFAAVQNEMAKHVLPPIPFLPIKNQESYQVDDWGVEHPHWMNDAPIGEKDQFFPFSFEKESDGQPYLLPWEPLINVSAKNIIAKRYVAKAGSKLIGSIKERFSTDDYQITITGAFYGPKMRGKYEEVYPKKDMEKLRDYLLTAEKIRVYSEPLQLLGITHIVIEEVNFPFTKGEDVQAYEITAVSDFDWSLLYEKKIGRVEVGEMNSNIVEG